MEITSLIKLLMRNARILIGIPLLMAVLVFVGTMNEKHSYSTAMSIYTGIASGVSLSSIEGGSRVDMFNTNNQFDNLINIIKSKQTYQEVALRLFAQGLSINAPSKYIISVDNFKRIHANIPEEVKKMVVMGNAEQTYLNFKAAMMKGDDNYFLQLLNSNDPHYSITALSKIAIKRIGNSDLVYVEYQQDDPGIAYQTLKILGEVFVINYNQIKVLQTDAVIKYFERELEKIAQKLRNAEDRLLEYYRSNSVINYNEQTRYIAEQKEYFETDYVREKMNYASTRAAAFTLESKMNIKDKIFLKNDSIVRLRNQLYLLNMKKTENLLSMKADIPKKSVGSSLYQQQIDSLVRKLNDQVLGSYKLQSSVEGIASEKILNSWLDFIVSNESSRAKIEVMDKRLSDFRKIYADMAPVGATIKRIEREIDINEQQYLSVLHSLNMAKLKLQDVELSSAIKLMDSPFFPLKPLSSSRKMMVIATFIGTLLLLIAIIIALEYFDRSIRTSERVEKLTGLQVLGIFPHLSDKNRWMEGIAARLSKIMAQDINNERSNSVNLNVGVMSIIDGEGKSTITKMLENAFEGIGVKAVAVDTKSQTLSTDKGNGHICLYELPSILLSPISIDTIKHIDFFILVVRANREWKHADSRALLLFRQSTDKRPKIILNGVEEDGLEHYLGDLPKERSKLRVWIKKILTLNFFTKDKL